MNPNYCIQIILFWLQRKESLRSLLKRRTLLKNGKLRRLESFFFFSFALTGTYKVLRASEPQPGQLRMASANMPHGREEAVSSNSCL